MTFVREGDNMCGMIACVNAALAKVIITLNKVIEEGLPFFMPQLTFTVVMIQLALILRYYPSTGVEIWP
jgi:hypothetical protein